MEDIRFVTDAQTKRRKPFAFARFKHEESVQYAIRIFRDVKLFGRHIQMQHRSKPRADLDRQRTISAPPQVFRPPPAPGGVHQNDVQIVDDRRMAGRHPDDSMRMQPNYQRQNSAEYHQQQNYHRQNSDEQYQQQNYHRQNSDDNFNHRSRRDDRDRHSDHDRSYDGYSNDRDRSERSLSLAWDRQFGNNRGSFDQQQQGHDSGYVRNDQQQQQWHGRGGHGGGGGYPRNDQQQQWQGRDRSYDRNNDRNNFDTRDRSRSRRR